MSDFSWFSKWNWNSGSKLALAITCGALASAIVVVSSPGVNSAAIGNRPLLENEDETPEPEEPTLAAASDAGVAAIADFTYPEGVTCEMFAAEPDVGNIIAFHRDYQGNLYACETYRQGKAIEDNRNHSYWLDDDLQAQTVQDRIDYILKHHPEAKETYTRFDDRIRVLSDTDNDGKADQTKVYANGFNKLEMGSGAGVLSYRGDVYYTCIPSVFKMRDTDGDLVSDERTSLSDGYGVRFAFRGHDSHGLIVGPDGMLYFSIGDRGYNLAPNMRDPASGAVFRCELDGSNLEVVATGLRNPQELAFDDYGDLFTGDNNSDGGDEARWTYIVPGGDTGWRMYYQYMGDRGPWNRELMWDDENDEKPAYIIPCIKNISDGPSGLEYYPGTGGFSDDFDKRFFLCDFRGTPINSGVRSFRNKPKGAFYELVDDEKPFWSVLVTDIDFASDGKMYLSDWVFGWNGENKGRIYTYFDKEKIKDPVIAEVEAILRDGLKEKSVEEVSSLFSHKDQRVRQEAQFELVRRKDVGALQSLASPGGETLPRLHAMWGIGQLLRGGMQANSDIENLATTCMKDNNPYIFREGMRLAGSYFPSLYRIAELTCDNNDARIRYESAMALGKIGKDSSADAICKLLIRNNNEDPIVRHGGIMAIRGIAIKEHENGESTFIDKMATHDSAAVRLATVVALRKQFEFNVLEDRDNTYVVRLLGRLINDADSTIALEAARAVHDLQMDDAMEPLAKLVAKADLSDHMIRRAISANNRIGDKESATRLASFVADSGYDAELKKDAMRLLGEWESPDPHDPVTNAYRVVDTSKRKVADAAQVVGNIFDKLDTLEKSVVEKVVDVAAKLKVKKAAGQIYKIVMDDKATGQTRASALSSLENLEFEGLGDTLAKLGQSSDQLPPELTSAYMDVLSRRDPASAAKMLATVIKDSGSSAELRKQQQKALATLGNMKSPESESMLNDAFTSLSEGTLPAELQLDLLKACEARGASVAQKAKAYFAKLETATSKTDQYLWAMKGGDPEKGLDVFRYNTSVSCLRCHRIDGTGGRVGPDLSGVGKQYDHRTIVESIADPNAKTADGFGQIVVATDDGLLVTGIVKEETEDQLALMDKDGVVKWIDKESIEGRRDGESSMPTDLIEKLSRDEIRDLVAYLVERVTPAEPAAGGHEE